MNDTLATHPRSVIACGASMGVALSLAVTVAKLPTPATASVFTTPAASASAHTTSSAGVAAQPAAPSEPLAIVGAYNAASIAAAASGDASLVLSFFAAGSREPDAIRAEFARRAARGEQHRSSLVRWGVAEQHASGGSASIVTQEVWDDQVYRNGERVDSRYGSILRVRYSLSRAGVSAPWLIQTIHSTVVVP